MMSNSKLVLVTVKEGVANVVLNRPEQQNAWNAELGSQYFEALHGLARDSEVRVVVVSGAGGAFCVGGDVNVLSDIAEDGARPGSQSQHPYWSALAIGKPVIGAIAGPCFGLGLQQALCFDIRFAAEDAKFSTAYVRRGVVAEMGMSWLLPRIVGLGHAADLLMSARVVRANEAARIGLVNRVVPSGNLEEEVLAYARRMASLSSPRSMRTMKAQLYNDQATDFLDAFGRAEALLDEAFESSDFAEGIASWKEERAPAFPSLAQELAIIDIEPGR